MKPICGTSILTAVTQEQTGEALAGTFFATQDRETLPAAERLWHKFSIQELWDALKGCSDHLGPGLDHISQFGGICQNLTKDMGSYITHRVCLEWARKLRMSVVAFDLTQFFPSVQHRVLLELLQKASFSLKLVHWMESYLIGQKTTFAWGNIKMDEYDASIGVAQGSALSPILAALYLSLLIKCFHKMVEDMDLISFVDDGTLVVQAPTCDENLAALKGVYAVIMELMKAISF